MIQCHVYLEGRVNIAFLDLAHDFFERFEVLRHGLVNQDIAVGEIKDFLFCLRFMQTMYYLKCSICLACAGSHHYQHTFLSFGYGLDGSVDCYPLIITWLMRIGIGIIRSVNNILLLHRQFLMIEKSDMEFIRSRKFVNINCCFLAS